MPVSYKEIDNISAAGEEDNLEDEAERVTEQIAALKVHNRHMSYSSVIASSDHEM